MNIAPARPVSRDLATGNDVGVLVHRFYRAAIPDPLLGPVFERFGVDWSRHLPRLAAYWEHVLLGRPGLATNTVAVHGGVQHVAPFGPARRSIVGSNCGKKQSTSSTSVRSPTSRRHAPARSAARCGPSAVVNKQEASNDQTQRDVGRRGRRALVYRAVSSHHRLCRSHRLAVNGYVRGYVDRAVRVWEEGAVI
jgi:hypothetical protein